MTWWVRLKRSPIKPAGLILRDAKGSAGLPMPLTQNKWLGFIDFRGWDGSQFARSAMIGAIAESTFSTNQHSTYLKFDTTSETTTSEKMRITSTGKVGIGTMSQNAVLHLYGSTGNITARIESVGSGNPWVDLFHARDGSTIVQDGDSTGGITFKGYDGSTYLNTAYILSRVDGLPGPSSRAGRLMFFTTPSGSGNSLERMRINSAGNVGIGTTDPGGYKLYVAGYAYSTGGWQALI